MLVRSFAAALLLLGQVPALALQTPRPAAPAELTAQQWREDLRFMAAEMERRHKNLFHTVSRDRFLAAVADLDRRIPSLQRNEIIVGMMRIAAMIGDGHTRVEPRKDARFGFRSLPLRLYLFEDGVYIRAAAPEHAGLVGSRIEAIGGVPIQEAIRRVSEISSRENEIGPRLFVPLYINMPDILHALGMSSRRDSAVLRLRKGGRSRTVTIASGEVEPLWPPDTDASFIVPEGWVDSRTGPQPLWLQAPLDYHRLVELPDRRAIYVQLNMVANIPGQSLAQFGQRIRSRAAATNPRALILDLRLNQGGNGNLRNGFVPELIRAEDQDTRLFVLTWRGTFSASQFILDDLDRLTEALFIGEPASSRPSSFGDAYRMPLPHSGITVRSSINWWQQGQNMHPWTFIDLAAPLTFAAYVEGRDPALEAALDYRPRPPLHQLLTAAARAGGSERVRRELRGYQEDPAHRYSNVELATVQAAEHLYAGGFHQEALMVAELATTQFPGSTDAFFVLAHLAQRSGQVERARQAVTRTLELDPNHRDARSFLERLPRPAPGA
jgi:tetratricopeptide (TPR) repeat protein